jgi:hypothetical protein
MFQVRVVMPARRVRSNDELTDAAEPHSVERWVRHLASSWLMLGKSQERLAGQRL